MTEEFSDFLANYNVDLSNKEFQHNDGILEKRFYTVAYWDSGSNGSYSDTKTIVHDVENKLVAGYDESFDLAIFDLQKNKEVYICDVVEIIYKGD